MADYNLFSFVENFSRELATLSIRIEDQLFEQPQATLMQARLFSEQLVKLISNEEEIEKLYPLKHSERIHKLYRNNAIEEDIYMKLEWLRKKGNSAAHSIKEVEVEDILKAHRFLFDISVWYMQIYVSYDFEAPVYKLPIKSKQEPAEIGENLDGLIKPYIDQTLKKIDDMWAEINQELQAIKKEKEQLALSRHAEEQSTAQEEKDKQEHFSLFKYLDENNLEYIDKRDKKGALWVIGDWSISEKLFPLKAHKIYFRYSKKGGRSTDYRPAWFLLNKTLPDIPLKELSETNNAEKIEKTDETTKKRETIELTKTAAPSIKIASTTSSDWQEKGQILIPVHLASVELKKWPFESIEQLSLQKFGDFTDEFLRDVFRKSQIDFHKTMVDLYWLGFRFTGNLAKFQPGPTNLEEQKILVSEEKTISIDSILPPHLAAKLKGRFVNSIKDLNNILISSIEFLFKEDAKYVLKLIQDKVNLQEQNETLVEVEIENENVEGSNSQKWIKGVDEAHVMYKNQTLTIKGGNAKRPLKELGLQGCNALVNRIRKIGVYTLADIKEPIDDIHLKLHQVGPGTVEKFWHQLQLLNGEIGISAKKEIAQEKGVIELGGESIKIDDEVKDEKLKQKDFPGLEGAVSVIVDNQMETFGQLPGDFSEIGQLKGIGKVKVKRLFQRISTILDKIRKEKEISKLSEEERLLFEINEYEKWFSKISHSEEGAKVARIAWRYLKLVKDRYEALQEGKHLTLEMLGEQEGVTRERIRQIFAKGDDQVCQRFSVIVELLRKRLEANGNIIVRKLLPENGLSSYLLWTAMERKGIFAVQIGAVNVLTLKEPNELEEYVEDIQQEVEKVFALHVITKEELNSFSRDRGIEDEVDASIIYSIANEKIHWLSENQGVLNNLRKIDILEMVMLQYPNGVEIYKREEELMEKANDISPGSFIGERAIAGILNRDNILDRFALWGRGVYIHSKFITDDEEWVLSIQNIVEKWLEKEGFIHVLRLYEEIKMEAKTRNIPNEYALYSLLRIYSKDTLAFSKFPMITLAGIEQQPYAEWVIQYIEEQGRPVTTEELVDVFVHTRGWKRFSLEQNLFKTKEIIAYEHGSYTLLSNYQHIQPENLLFIVRSVEQQLEEKSLIFINAVFEDNEPILKSLGIETSYILYAVLREFSHVKAKLPRFPYVVALGHEADLLSGRRLIERIIKDEGTIIAREEVNQLIKELFGHNNRILDLALVQSNDILYYTKGQFGEYIHRDTINMHGESEQKIHEIVKARYDEVSAIKKREYVLLNEIYNPSILPPLTGNITWSEELLGDILKKSDGWLVIGSFDEVLLPVGESITDDITFIDYILTHDFDGAVKLSKLESYLSKIRYSGHGQLLKDVVDAIENGTAPYSIIGDELIHNELNGGN